MRITTVKNVLLKYVAYIVSRLFVLTILILPTSISFAAADNFKPYVYTSVSYDSNLVRVADDAEAISVLGNTNTDDTVKHLGAGFRAELPVSRQRLQADVSVDRANHDTFKELNHTRSDGRAVWRWQVGNLWSGNLGFQYRERLSSFYELQSVLKDVRTQNIKFLDASYQIHPDWRLVAGLSQSDEEYKERKALDKELRSEQFEIQYRNTINSRVGLRAKVTESNLPNLENVSGNLVNNDSKKTEISGVFFWEGTRKSHFEARFGVTEQKYDELAERNFQGSIGRLNYRWLMTRITNLGISLWKETATDYNGEIATDGNDETATGNNGETTTLIVTRGVSISPTWSATRKITVRGQISYEQNDFEGESAVILGSGLEPRKDYLRLFDINVSYASRQNVKWSLAYQTGERTSNRKESEFDYNQVKARVQMSF